MSNIIEDRSFLLLKIPQENTKKEDSTKEFLSQLSEILKGEKCTLSCEIVIYGKYLWFFITCPTRFKDLVKGQWFSQYSGAEIEDVSDYLTKVCTGYQQKYYLGTELYYEQNEFLPIKTYKEIEKSLLMALSGIIHSFNQNEVGIVQLILKPGPKENLWFKFKKKIRENNRNKYSNQSNQIPEYVVLSSEKEDIPYFYTTIRFLVLGEDKDRVRINLSSIINVHKKNLERPKIQKLKEDKFYSNPDLLKTLISRLPGRHQARYSTEEIATIFHLPYKEEEITQITQIQSKKSPPPQNLPRSEKGRDVAVFGETNYQNEMANFGLNIPDRRRHLYVIGKTGVGKTKLLELLIKSDLESGYGVILLDPHGDLAREVLNYIPQNRFDDVIYFNPTDINYPIGFNPMEAVESFEFKQNVVSGFIAIFKKLFGLNWNERFEHVLRYTTLALLEYPQASVLGIPRMLTDNLFRQDVLNHVSDPLVKKFWATEFSSWNEQFAGEAIVPIINKIGQFIANPMVRNIIGQTKTGFPLDEIMNKEKILIANLSIGKLGEENSALLGSMLVTKIWQTAMARSSLLENQRKDTFLYVDEFQNFATSAFSNILSEARKYKLNLTVAHQYMQQLTPEVRAAIFGNVGNILSFRVGGDDAQILIKEFEPTFNVNDLINLDLRHFYVKMSIDGEVAKPFSAQTIDLNPPSSEQSKHIIELSRRKWAKPKRVIEEEIEKWEKGEIIADTTKEKSLNSSFPEPLV